MLGRNSYHAMCAERGRPMWPSRIQAVAARMPYKALFDDDFREVLVFGSNSYIVRITRNKMYCKNTMDIDFCKFIH